MMLYYDFLLSSPTFCEPIAKLSIPVYFLDTQLIYLGWSIDATIKKKHGKPRKKTNMVSPKKWLKQSHWPLEMILLLDTRPGKRLQLANLNMAQSK